VPKNATTDIVTTHTDLAPTFLYLVGAPLRPDFDGEAIPLSKTGIEDARQKRHEHVNVEYWGFALGEGKTFSHGMQFPLQFNPLFCSSRRMGWFIAMGVAGQIGYEGGAK
jgi:arylsulfatase A-like enzyme